MEYLLTGRWVGVAKSYGWLMIAILNLPVLLLVPVSFGRGHAITFPPNGFSLEWYSALVTNPTWGRTALISLEVAILATAIAVVIGTAAAIGISRVRGPLGKALKMLFILPMIVPLMVIGVGFYIAFAHMGLLGKLLPLAMAHAIAVLPFVVMPIMSRLISLDPALERASASLGANARQRLLHITLPLLVPAIIAAAVFAFIFSFDEVVLAQLLAGPRFETLPRKIWEAVTLDGADKSVTAIASIQLFIVLVFVAGNTIIDRYRSRRRRALPS